MATTKKTTRKTATTRTTPAKKRVKKASVQSKPKAATKTTRTRKAATRKKGIAPADITHGVIARRAYSLWQQQGCRHGHDLNHWLEAEVQLRREAGAIK